LLFWTFDFERKKGSRIFLPKKLQIFKKYRLNTIQKSCTKKDTILHHAPQITFFYSLCIIWSLGTQLCLEKGFFSRVKSLQLLNQSKHISVALPRSKDKIWSKGQSQEIPELWSDIQTNNPRLYFFTCIGNKQW